MLSDTQKLSLLSLYSREICQRLQFIDESRATSLLELVEKGIVDRLRAEFPDNAVGTELWRELLASPMKNKIYDSMLAYFHEVGDELRDSLSFVDRRSQFNVVLQHLEDFMKHLDKEKCLEYLKSIKQYKDVITSITENCDEKDEDYIKRLLLRTIPCLGRTAVYDIMFSIQETSEDGFKFIDKIHPNFLRYYELLKRERTDSRGRIRFWPEDGDLSTFLGNKSDADGSSPAHYIQVDLNFDDLPDSLGVKRRLLSCINNRTFKETPLYLRDYQKELCEAAKAGENCIVSAPTGSGKTIVAASIIKHHLSTSQRAKVLFLVSNTAIINQQADCMAKFLEHRYEVDRICGMDNKPIKEMIRASDVLVCTPQLIVNLISGKNLIEAQAGFDCPTEAFRLDVFSLIVFDECHNTKKSSPYSVLMQHYHRAKSTGIYKKGPQIVGLTASLGVGNATKNLKDALQHIVGLCALLDSKTISVVRKHADELKQFSPPTADEFDFCGDQVEKEEPERISFMSVMFRTMSELERKINAIFSEAQVTVASPSNSSEDLEGLNERVGPVQYNSISKAPQDKGSMDYLNWVSCHLNRLIPESPMEGEQKKRITEIFEMLHMFFRSLELCDDFTTRKSFDYLEENFQKKKNYTSWDIVQIIEKAKSELKPLCTDKCILVTAVEKHLLSQHAAAGNSRSIIFVRTRTGAKILSSLLNSLSGLKEAKIASEPLFGINANDDGSSKRLQAEKLAKFASGETRVLVSTSVAEEGLDIAQCNLVIKYNYTTNEIAHVQRRGRGRAKGSRCILVTNADRLRKQEEGNVMKERLMQQAMDQIERCSFDLKSMVERKVKELREGILTADLKEQEKVEIQKQRGIVYELQCKSCSAVLCTDAHIKNCNDSQYCVTDPSFWQKVEAKPISEDAKNASKYGAVGEFFCNAGNNEGRKCGRTLGRVVQVANGCIPCLAADAFILFFIRNGGEQRRTVKQWKKVKEEYFTPEPLRTHDLAKMQEASTFAPIFSGNI